MSDQQQLYLQSYGGLFLSSDSAPLVQRKSIVTYVHTHVNRAIVYNYICFMHASFTHTHTHTHARTHTHNTHTHTIHECIMHRYIHIRIHTTNTDARNMHTTHTCTCTHACMHTRTCTHTYTHAHNTYLPGDQLNSHYPYSNLNQPYMNYTYNTMIAAT